MTWDNRSVIITGGAGFLGSNLAGRLVELGAHVKIIDNLERGRLEYLQPFLHKIEFYLSDLRDYRLTQKAMRGADVVFHLAAKVGGIKFYVEHPGSVLSDCLKIDQNVLTAALNENVRSIFYASSTHVYPHTLQQTPDSPPLTEADAYPASPGLSYGWAKIIGEQTLLGFIEEKRNFNVSIARICGAYGYNQDIRLTTGSFIPVFCHRVARALDGETLEIWGTGNETRSFCFIDDVIDGIMLSIQAQGNSRVVGPFNLGAEGRYTIREIAERIVAISKKNIPLQFDTTVSTALWGQAIRCSMAHQLLNKWHSTTTLDDGLRKTYEHIQRRLLTGAI